MTTEQKVQSLIRQVAALPEKAQAELVESLIGLRAQYLGVYQLDDDDRASLARSAEDIRLGRFASDAEIEETYACYGA